MTDYASEIADWQAYRFSHLTAEDGWLNVIGRFWLETGSATVGAGESNDIVLTAGPDLVGTITVDEAGVGFAEPGQAAFRLDMGAKPFPRFTIGNIHFEVTTMDGRHALRARDIASAARRDFKGLGYFPTDPAWRKVADWVKLDAPRQMDIDTVYGIPTTVTITSKAVFEHAGTRYELLPYSEGTEPMFVLRDLTSRSETYGAARFLYATDVTETSIVLDFNKAFSPPCAFTQFAVCPLPPPENIMPIRVEAGEMKPSE